MSWKTDIAWYVLPASDELREPESWGEMPDEDYERCRFSVSCETDDLAVLHCLRSLAQFAEGSRIPNSIPWGGTGEREWQKSGGVVTFRFTSPDFRSAFLEEACRLLPDRSWSRVAEDDNDPARRQRRRRP